jgi:hypothetical protein
MKARGAYTGALIQTVRDERTGKSAEIRYDKNKHVFWTVIGEDHFTDAAQIPVYHWIRNRINKSDEIAWQPIMEFDANERDRYRYGRGRRGRGQEHELEAQIEFRMSRYYVGRTESGKWFETSWDSMDKDHADHLEPERLIANAKSWSIGSHAEDPSYYENRERLRLGKKLPVFKLPFSEGSTRYLPYDEDAWNGALIIVENIEQTQATLDKLFSLKTAVTNLKAIATGSAPVGFIGSGK